MKTVAMNKNKIRSYIDEYVGSHFRFLEHYIEGGYEDYVRNNLRKITHKKVFGVEKKRSEFSKINSPQILEQKVLEFCEQTLEYIKNSSVCRKETAD